MKYSLLIFAFPFLMACNTEKPVQLNNAEIKAIKDSINIMLDKYHEAAAQAQFNDYFDYFDDDAIFTGTDATERWDKKSFMDWSKPYFEKGKAWSFTALERNIFLSADGKFAWFDELLDTQMKICRGSGVVSKTDKGWKIKQYILSMTIPNSQLKGILLLKSHEEDSVIAIIKNQ
jgi:hypothetical protein